MSDLKVKKSDGSWLSLKGPQGDAGGSLPAGLIVMWAGLLANIPTGWALCDGQNGTPDLRDKFIKGWADGVDPGGTGGNLTHTHGNHASHTHTYSQVLNHTHTVNVTDPGHAHTQRHFPTATGGSTGNTIDTSMSGTQTNQTLTTATATTGITATTSDPAGGAASGTTAGPSAALSHDSVNHEPPYYKLAFIIKL